MILLLEKLCQKIHADFTVSELATTLMLTLNLLLKKDQILESNKTEIRLSALFLKLPIDSVMIMKSSETEIE